MVCKGGKITFESGKLLWRQPVECYENLIELQIPTKQENNSNEKIYGIKLKMRSYVSICEIAKIMQPSAKRAERKQYV